MSSRSAKAKSDTRGVVVVKQRANAYTMMLLFSFTALAIGCWCLYALMNNYYAMKVKVDGSDKAPQAKVRQPAGGQQPDGAQPPAGGQPPAEAPTGAQAPAPAGAGILRFNPFAVV